MTTHKPLHGVERRHLIDELYQRYGTSSGSSQKLVYLRKKYSWLIVVTGAKVLKRVLDIVVSVVLLVLLFPLMLLLAVMIKLTDRGPVLYVVDRVGRWGKEFRFPKFRSMRAGANAEKRNILHLSDHSESLTFKMRRDPRVTWIGRLMRRTSLDELPQLWCVLKGEMALVGPRPPLLEEVEHYDIEQRKRLDVKPGLTCIWQVEGRSEIPFPHQLKLDLQYIESQSFWLDMLILLKTIPAVLLGRGAY